MIAQYDTILNNPRNSYTMFEYEYPRPVLLLSFMITEYQLIYLYVIQLHWQREKREEIDI